MTKKQKRILIIDDDPSTIRLLEKRLGANGYDIVKAFNGHIGYQLAKNEHPDLIVLDMIMPDMSGGEVAQKLQEDPQTREIPIVFLTITLSKKDKKEIVINGHTYRAVAKPFFNPELLSAIRKSMKKNGPL